MSYLILHKVCAEKAKGRLKRRNLASIGLRCLFSSRISFSDDLYFTLGHYYNVSISMSEVI
ncbi:hypothetical protein [Neisseria sicca]|uniref:hypothetical protein n=1 Tax=Neisseria sicca TaxID=490 RepID=UPI00031757AD|nr:hypothetical protein [Neisseria sicca]